MALCYSATKDTYNKELDGSYFESEEFASYCMNGIKQEISNLIYTDGVGYRDEASSVRIYHTGTYNYFRYLKNCKFLIIYNPTNKVYTNVNNLSGLEEILDYVKKQEGKKITISDGRIEADSEIVKANWEEYKGIFSGSYYYTGGKYYTEVNDVRKYKVATEGIDLENVEDNISYNDYQEKGIVDVTTTEYRIEDFEIYMTYEEEFLANKYSTNVINMMKGIEPFENAIFISVPICGVLIAVIGCYLIIAIGYKKGKEGIDLNDIDKIPLEIIFGVLAIIVSLVLMVGINIDNLIFDYYKLYISGIVTVYLVICILAEISITTFIKRIKSKTLIKNTLTWRLWQICKKLFDKMKEVGANLAKSTGTTWKVIGAVIAYVILMTMLISMLSDFGIFLDICITSYIVYKFIQRVNNFKKIEDRLKDIYEGNNEEKLYEEEFSAIFQDMVRYINDISNGFENAVEEGIKSERLKTELITNVSHDIKTPLTSIINYVDLIKREDIKNEKVREYIEILEAKSHRLKRLTEDLVEASKVSSGNVKLNLERLNLVQLINQATGEFEDKFNERKLDLIINSPKEDIFIEADSRYMYRIIENVFSNISKYALEASRVYIDVINFENKVKVEIKNISEDKLNISEEELMQRFVRGDKSRTTEGSGLRFIDFEKFS